MFQPHKDIKPTQAGSSHNIRPSDTSPAMSQILEPLTSVLPTDVLQQAVNSSLSIPLVVAASTYGAYTLLNMGSRTKDMPPGPPTVPILGNANIFPKEFPHFQFTEWGKYLGSLF
jgi:hypothetical protein